MGACAALVGWGRMIATALIFLALGLDTLAVALGLGLGGLPRARWLRVGLVFACDAGGRWYAGGTGPAGGGEAPAGTGEGGPWRAGTGPSGRC